MKGSKTLLSNALSTLKGNVERTGDPLGFKGIYWTEWSDGLGLERTGKTLLLTARMYQMLPYVIQTTDLMTTARPLLATRGLNSLVAMGNRLAGERVIRIKAKGETKIREKGIKALRGIVASLNAVDRHPAYLYEEEPYSGVLLYDLGLEKDIAPHINRVVDLLKRRGIEEVITVDPHTTFMLKEIYPKYFTDYDIQVRNYLEVLSQRIDDLKAKLPDDLPKQFVIHDSCVMTRDLGIVEEARRIAEKIGIKLIEPENSGLNTACCGGPVEYAFADLSHQISAIRMSELSGVQRDMMVTCPICLVNLSKYERELGIRVWDMGEVLYAVLRVDQGRDRM